MAEKETNDHLCEKHKKEFTVFHVGGCVVCWKDFEVESSRSRIAPGGAQDQLRAESIVNKCLCAEPAYNCEESVAVHFNDLVDLTASILSESRRLSLEWAAQWIENSLSGESDARVIEFARNMVMSIRSAALPDPPEVNK